VGVGLPPLPSFPPPPLARNSPFGALPALPSLASGGPLQGKRRGGVMSRYRRDISSLACYVLVCLFACLLVCLPPPCSLIPCQAACLLLAACCLLLLAAFFFAVCFMVLFPPPFYISFLKLNAHARFMFLFACLLACLPAPCSLIPCQAACLLLAACCLVLAAACCLLLAACCLFYGVVPPPFYIFHS
jgi:hypothetical protein